MTFIEKRCPNCGEPIQEDWLFCHHCRAEILRCAICFQVLSKEEKLLQCPYCRELYHAEHLEKWLEQADFCPHCKNKISKEVCISLTLATFREYSFDLDLDEKPDPSLVSQLSFQLEFWRSQKLILEKFEEVRATLKRKFYVVSPPGSGKTIIGLEIATRLGGNALVLVPNSSTQVQWIDKIKHFIPAEMKISPTTVGSTSAFSKAPITVMTYQRFSVYETDQEILDKTAVKLWLKSEDRDYKELAMQYLPGNKIINSEEEFIQQLKEIKYDVYKKFLEKYRKKIREAIWTNKFDILSPKDVLHENTVKIIEQLKKKGINTIILDECHHLTVTWAYIVKYLIEELNKPFVVGLTATPPIVEKEKKKDEEQEPLIYDLLFGEVDIEIPTPAAVKQRNLAPFQDLLYVNNLTKDERVEIDDKINEVYDYVRKYAQQGRKRKNKRKKHKQTQQTKEEYQRRSFCEPFSGLIKRIISGFRQHKTFTNFSVLNTKELMQYIVTLETPSRTTKAFLLYQLYMSLKNNDNEKDKKSRKFLKLEQLFGSNGFIETALARSKSKIHAAVKILETEYKHMQSDLRATIVYDAFQEENMLKLLELITTHRLLDDLDAVLIHNNVIYADKDFGKKIIAEAEQFSRNFKLDFSIKLVEEQRIYKLEGVGRDWRRGTVTLFLTYMLEKGLTQCLIGPRALLGEGWDSNCLNCLIDLTNISAYQTVVQVKGRAYRLDVEHPEKLANIWEVAVVEDDYMEVGYADFNRVLRKHEHFYSLSEDGTIEKGAGHIFPSLEAEIKKYRTNFQVFNNYMLSKAQKRAKFYELWQIGSDYENVELLALDIRFPKPELVVPYFEDQLTLYVQDLRPRFFRKSKVYATKTTPAELLQSYFYTVVLLRDYLKLKGNLSKPLERMGDIAEMIELFARAGGYVSLLAPTIDKETVAVLKNIVSLNKTSYAIEVKDIRRLHKLESGYVEKISIRKARSARTVYLLGLPFLNQKTAEMFGLLWSRTGSVSLVVKKRAIEKVREKQEQEMKVTERLIWR